MPQHQNFSKLKSQIILINNKSFQTLYFENDDGIPKEISFERNLESPDGRPLYEYKISNESYQELKSILHSSRRNDLGFEACFVLYAVEF